MSSAISGGPCENTDRELFREKPDDYYAASLHVTKEGSIGINVGGTVYVRPLREWHAAIARSERTGVPATHVSVPRRFIEEFIKAVDFHNGHGTPSIDRMWAHLLVPEAEALLTEQPSRADKTRSDTPETDAWEQERWRAEERGSIAPPNPWERCRQLERRLNALGETLTSCEEHNAALHSRVTNNQSETPRSDAHLEAEMGVHCRTLHWHEFARQLERELARQGATLGEQIDRLRSSISFEVPADAPTVQQIEEFRREYIIPDDGNLLPWAIESNKVLNYLCYRACTPLTVSATAQPSDAKDAARYRFCRAEGLLDGHIVAYEGDHDLDESAMGTPDYLQRCDAAIDEEIANTPAPDSRRSDAK